LAGPEATRWDGAAKKIFPSGTRLCELAAEAEESFRISVPEPIYLREVSFVKAPPSRTY
jgi:hypothetical protein